MVITLKDGKNVTILHPRDFRDAILEYMGDEAAIYYEGASMNDYSFDTVIKRARQLMDEIDNIAYSFASFIDAVDESRERNG